MTLENSRRPLRRATIPVSAYASLIASAAALIALVLPAAASAAPPTLTIDAPTAVETTKAHVSGEVSVPLDGQETYWCFEYSKESAEEWSGFCYSGPVQPGESVPVEADLSGLHSNRKYKLRLAALNFSDFVEEFSSIEKFKTDPAPIEPTPTINAPTDVSYTTAKISGLVDPEGGNQESGGDYVPIQWTLELRDATAEGSFEVRSSGEITGAEASEDFGPGEGILVGPTELTGLIPGHQYNFQLGLTFGGVDNGDAGSFTTLAVAKPTITDLAITEVTADSAHFAAEIDPHAPEPIDPAFDTEWHFQCTPACGSLQGGTVSGAPETVENDTTALQPNTFYTVRLFASNSGGQVKATETFKTEPAAPLVESFNAGPITPTSAGINAEINPRGSDTLYWFEWGVEDCSTPEAVCQSIPAEHDASAGSGQLFKYVSRQLTGLSPETTYHFHLVARNDSGTVEGSVQEFTTGGPEPTCSNTDKPGARFLPGLSCLGDRIAPRQERRRRNDPGDEDFRQQRRRCSHIPVNEQLWRSPWRCGRVPISKPPDGCPRNERLDNPRNHPRPARSPSIRSRLPRLLSRLLGLLSRPESRGVRRLGLIDRRAQCQQCREFLSSLKTSFLLR